MESDYEVRIILLGESDVGKTSLVLRFVENKFRDSPSRTIVNKYEKFIHIEGKLVKLTLWDTAGRKEYNGLIKNYYNIADGVLLIYDIQNSNTFFELSKWLKKFKSVNENAEVLVAGNKLEEESDRSINLADVENFVRTEKIDYIEVSAKLNININILFHHILQKVLVTKGILKYSKDNQLAELERSRGFILSNSVSAETLGTVNTSNAINVRSTTDPFVNHVESIEQDTSSTINAFNTAVHLDSCEESIEQSTSSTINTFSTAVHLDSCEESIEQNTSSTINAFSTPVHLGSCEESIEQSTSSTINAFDTAVHLGSCEGSIEQSTSNEINISSSTESLLSCVKSVEQNSSRTIKASKAAELLIRDVEPIEENVSGASNTPSTTESAANCVTSVEHNTTSAINTPIIVASPKTCVESTEPCSDMLESASSIKINGKFLTNEICKVEDDEDLSLNDYGFICISEDDIRTISSEHSQSVDSAENAEEFFEKRRKKASLFRWRKK